MLGVSFDSKFGLTPHVKNLTQSAAQSMYALRVLRAHGMSDIALSGVVEATIVARLRYASQPWWGFVDCSSMATLNGIFSKLKRQNFLPKTYPDIQNLFQNDDCTLFENVVSNPNHVLHELLPPIRSTHYSTSHVCTILNLQNNMLNLNQKILFLE